MLVDILDLERIEFDIFRGQSPERGPQRVFGGQVAGQALVAAGRTVPAERAVHSLHAYFIRPGDPEVPIVYTVDRTRDGRSFSTRRVTAIQHGRAIFTLSASFHVPEAGPEHHAPMPEAPDPEGLPERSVGLRAVEIRYDEDRARARGGRLPREPRGMVWLRVREALPDDDPLLHVCAAAYVSDMTLLDSVLMAHGLTWDAPGLSAASLDHAMWFHVPFRADDWLLYAQESPAAAGARGLAQGRIFRRDGRLVASVVQEGLIRVTGAQGD
ncbi:MAG TPA: acyl-CoA thioesterase II [Candidatus Dormibacteraeota bacterium]|jgi:acyl-CoA thioesterase-2